VSTSFSPPEFDSRCLGRRTEPRVPTDINSAMRRVDVSRFFSASDYSSVATDSPRRYVDDRTGAIDDDLTAADCVRLDVLRIVLAVIDFFVVLHRCACLGCCCCCWHRDGQLITETSSSGSELMRNGVTGGDIILCSKHDGARQQRKHRTGRAPNGSVSRPCSSFNVYDVEEYCNDVPGGLYPLCRRRQRGEDASFKAMIRGHDGRSSMRRRWTPEQRRRRRQLTALLTRLVLCSIVLSLVYIVVRSLDAIMAELLTVTTNQPGVQGFLVTETFLGEIFAQQVCRTFR